MRCCETLIRLLLVATVVADSWIFDYTDLLVPIQVPGARSSAPEVIDARAQEARRVVCQRTTLPVRRERAESLATELPTVEPRARSVPPPDPLTCWIVRRHYRSPT